MGMVVVALNLESAVGREIDVQDIEVHREFEKYVVTYTDVGYADNARMQLSVTLLVMSIFSKYLVMRHSGALRARLKAPTFGAQTLVIQLRIPGLRETCDE